MHPLPTWSCPPPAHLVLQELAMLGPQVGWDVGLVLQAPYHIHHTRICAHKGGGMKKKAGGWT